VYMDNFYPDTVAGFNLWLQLDRPDIMEFQTEMDTSIDTTYWDCLEWNGPDCVDSELTIWWYECTEWIGDSCIDSFATPGEEGVDWDFMNVDSNEIFIGNFDTVGTLISGWELVESRSLSGVGHDINIAGIADLDGGDFTQGIPPQQGGLLVKLLADVYNIPDSMTERSVHMLIQHEFIDHFSFSRPNGTAIGIAYEQVLDTNYWVCLQWIEDVCVAWERTSGPPYDSLEIVPDSIPYVDTNIVILTDGRLTVDDPPPWVCGNINNDPSGLTNIADLTYLVAYLFGGGPPPPVFEAADMQCNGKVNISDLTYFVGYLFGGGSAPCDNEGCW
jgi:hypothetical protein